MISIRNITKIYSSGNTKTVALDNVNLDFPENGLVFVVGKSGAGKSTLLNILGGLDLPTSGNLYIDGKDTKSFTSKDFDDLRNNKIGFIFQEFNLLDDATVYDNVAISLKMQSKSHDVTLIDEALKLVNLEGLGYRKISELSGGQKQRIAIARALIKNSSIILADEPTGALDSKTGYELMASLKSLSKDKLFIVVSHDEDMAYTFADYIIELNDGQIINQYKRNEKSLDESIYKISDDVIKISSGNILADEKIINSSLKEDDDNMICLMSSPEPITIANPELYPVIFKKEDYRSYFQECNPKLKEIQEENNYKINKSGISFKECFKMAASSYSKGKGRIAFLLLFTILSISLFGTSMGFLCSNNSKIIANTLLNNNMSLGIMRKGYDNDITNDDVQVLDDSYLLANFALSKKVNIKYNQVIGANNSGFAMENFTGIVECKDIKDLKLDLVVGKSAFDDYSLDNHEIIISDYASYELQRKGYLGYDSNDNYGIMRPISHSEVIGTKILFGDIPYTIVGIFDTNYEDYLSLLVDQTYNENDSKQNSSLRSLKNYYYARIFAPSGFYKKLHDENSSVIENDVYRVTSKNVEVPTTDGEYALSQDLFQSDYFDNFETLSSLSSESYTVSYGSIPTKLNNNEIIISQELLEIYKIKTTADFEKFIDTLGKVEIQKYNSSLSPTSTIYYDNLKVKAIISFSDQESHPYFYFSDEYASKFNETKYNYNQIMFTLSGGLYSYSLFISSLNRKGYTVLNIDGNVSFNTSDLETIQLIALIAGCSFILFSFLIILNTVATNVKNRKKEIGILRATGAKTSDVMKMFAIEEGTLALIISIISSLLVLYLSGLINGLYGNLDIGISLIVYDLILVVIIFATTFILIGIATVIPVLSIASQKPIEAIRQN